MRRIAVLPRHGRQTAARQLLDTPHRHFLSLLVARRLQRHRRHARRRLGRQTSLHEETLQKELVATRGEPLQVHGTARAA